MVSLQERANAFLDILDRPVPKALFAIWGLIAVWDTFVSQFIPEEIAKSFPKAHQVIAMTYGWFSVQTWLLSGAAIVVLVSLEYAARHRWKLELVIGSEPRKYDSKRPLLALFWLSIAALVVAIWWLSAAQWAMRVVPNAPASPMPTATPAQVSAPTPTPSAKQPPSPSPPWVTQDEIEEAKKVGRILLPFKPEELASMSYANGAENMTAYAGKWVKISKLFDHLSQKQLSDKKEYIIVTVRNSWSTTLLFASLKWQERLVIFRPGDQLNALCQLYPFEGEKGDPSGHIFIGTNCELR